MAKKRDHDDEEEEEEEEEEDPRRKRAKIFFDEEAEEDDEEEEEDDEGDELNDLINDEEEEAEAARDEGAQQNIESRRRRHEALFNKQDAEDIERYVERRYGTGREDVEDGSDDEPQTIGIEQQSLQPTVRDPKLFAVKCKINHEREAVIRLLQKHSNLLKRDQILGITSAVAPSHIKGSIYVESFKAEMVKFAIRGIDVLSEKGMQLVPLQEMVDVLNVPKRQEKVKIGDWVRVTRGLYTGDLGQVYDIHDGRGDGFVTLRLIPRINYTSNKTYTEDNLKNRPAQRLFDRDEAERLSNMRVDEKNDAYTGERYEKWRNETFAYGMLYKKMSARNLDTDIAQPQIEELEKFQIAEQKMRDAFAELEAEPQVPIDLSLITRQRKTSFFMGDSVVFIRGDLKGLKGVVESIEGDTVSVKCKELPEVVTCDRGDLTKSFQPGDNVKVASGRHAGETGVVVDVKGEILILFNDITKEEVKVLASNVLSGSDVGVSAEVTNLYQLFDLVSLHSDPRSKGVVVKVSKDNVTLLNTNGKTAVRPLQEIKSRVSDRGYRAVDNSRHPISIGDRIRVVEGPHAQRHGTVKHMADNFVFFQAPDETSNCGILVVPARCCVVQGNNTRVGGMGAFGSIGGAARHPFMAPKNGGGMGRGGYGGGRGRDPIVRKEVKIKSGPFKGYAGRAVDASNDTVRVELEGICKIITVGRNAVIPKDGTGMAPYNGGGFGGGGGGGGFGGGFAGGFGSRTPHRDGAFRAGSRTPMHEYGSRTPMHEFGSRTPMHEMGSRTPLHEAGSRTPMRDGFGARTPAHDPTRTPLHNSWSATPVHHLNEPRTPLHDGWRPVTPARHGGLYDDADRWAGAGPLTPANDDYPYRDARTPKTPGDPGTPAIDPRTPNTPMEPATPYDAHPASPGDEEEEGVGEAKAVIGVEVTLDDKHGYVADLLPDEKTYEVKLTDSGETRKVEREDFKLIRPEKNDKVKLLQGEASLVGQKGTLIGIDEEGIVRLEQSGDIKVVQFFEIGKVHNE